MKKIFENMKELMNFNLSELPPGRSNYISILAKNGLPHIRESQKFGKWRIVSKPEDVLEPQILMELTPRWLTISIYKEGEKSKRIDIECFRKNSKVIIQEVFEL